MRGRGFTGEAVRGVGDTSVNPGALVDPLHKTSDHPHDNSFGYNHVVRSVQSVAAWDHQEEIRIGERCLHCRAECLFRERLLILHLVAPVLTYGMVCHVCLCTR